MHEILTLVAVILFTFCGLAIQETTPSLDSLLPDALSGWSLDGDDAYYDHETIFEYMNGAGEVYRSYDYREMIVRRMIDDSNNEIVIELYDMGNGPDAFGIFARNRSGEGAGIGQGSEYSSGYLLFWQDRYFSAVYTYGENEKTKAAIYELGKAITGKIGRSSPPAQIIASLPEENLEQNSIRYFHLYTDLNQHYFVADENILDLTPETNAVVAQYHYADGDFPAILLIVDYPDSAKASRAFNTFAAAFMPESHGEPYQIEDGTWASARLNNDYIVAVFDATEKNQAETLIEHAIEKIKGDDDE